MHEITIKPAEKSLRVTWNGAPLASSDKALDLKEATYPVVKYVPRSDVDMSLLRKTTHHTHCPYKGNASYFSIIVDGKTAENAVWTYEAPFDAVAAIKDHLAFYPNVVTFSEG